MKLRVDFNRRDFERVRNRADLLVITTGDLRGPILTAVAQVHRKQERRIFASEGAEGASGSWPPLKPDYAKRKSAKVGRKPILVFSGDMRERFIKPSRPEYVEEYVAASPAHGVFRLGATSKIAGYHFEGNPNLPRRDMITKSAEQVAAIWRSVVDWYRTVRIPQVKKALLGLSRARR